jgi:hypothetical protein
MYTRVLGHLVQALSHAGVGEYFGKLTCLSVSEEQSPAASLARSCSSILSFTITNSLSRSSPEEEATFIGTQFSNLSTLSASAACNFFSREMMLFIGT